MIGLSQKKILLFYPYGTTKHYGDAIKLKLKEKGAYVVEYDERPSQKTLSKIIIRLAKKKIPYIFSRYIKKVITENIDADFDYILICRGEAFTPYTINQLKKAYPNAKIILYLWDILRSTKVSYNIPYCDKAMSFDPQDVEENEGLLFRPTFSVDEYRLVRNDIPKQNDLVFIGTLHSNRYKIIQSFDEKLKEQGIRFYKYLFIPSIIVYLKELVLKFPYIGINKVHFTPISLKKTISLLGVSKAILDINYTGQKSLSTRAFEAMNAQRKYITTNSEIKNYDFYDPNNILVVDIDNPIVPKEFLDSPFKPIDDVILQKYSIEGLIDDLFNDI